MPDDYRAILESVITLVAAGNVSVIATVNDINVPGGSSVPGGDEPSDNQAPSIQGVPSTSVQVGSSYIFDASASDPDGDLLTFSITGLPVWAGFNESTGDLSGTPGDGHVGVYTNIRISVSDGSVGVNLAPFSITVNAMGMGTVTLNWTAPTENEDGSILTDLDKYRIYWGTNPGNYPNSVTIDAGTTTYIVENLAAGTYEFVATSINAAGVESVFSNPATKTVL